jgi:hypothetical protein
MFIEEFAAAEMVCIIEKFLKMLNGQFLNGEIPFELRDCGFFHVTNDKIKFQRGYLDKLSFLKIHNLPLPQQ